MNPGLHLFSFAPSKAVAAATIAMAATLRRIVALGKLCPGLLPLSTAFADCADGAAFAGSGSAGATGKSRKSMQLGTMPTEVTLGEIGKKEA